jgi:hypothetical protein
MECITSWSHRNGLGIPINFEKKLWFVPDKCLWTQCHKPTKFGDGLKKAPLAHGDSWVRSLLGVPHWYKSTNTYIEPLIC